MKQLDRLLFLQGNKCFFCGESIPDGEASVEHLVASSNGGPKDDDNCVVCCKSVNLALGSLPIKGKIQAILNHKGQFACPVRVPVPIEPTRPAPPASPQVDRVNLVVADLVKRGASRPRRVATLKNTINALFQMSLTEAQVDGVLAELTSRGLVAVEETKVSYSLQAGA